MKSSLVRATLYLLLMLCTASPAIADNVSGVFKAVRSCEAYKSFKKGTNPGVIRTTAGSEYDAVEVNNKDMDWVRIKVPGINDPLRWVSAECGITDLTAAPPEEPGKKTYASCHQKNLYDSYVLAMTWQPGFCEHYSYQGSKPECNALRDGSLVVNHLTLHGLWPNRKECGTNYANCGGPGLNLEESTISQLSPWMPNFYYADTFGSYEWEKHGTCQERPDDEYFLTAKKLVEAVDGSVIGTYIKSRIGEDISAGELFQQIKDAYGPDVADRVQLLCAGGSYLQEIRVNLPRNFSVDQDLKKLTSGAVKMKSRTNGCSKDSIHIEKSGVR